MGKLDVGIIYDNSPSTERLIKFSMLYFDKVNLHFPSFCAAVFDGLSIENKASYVPGNISISSYNLFDNNSKNRFEKLSKNSNINVDEFLTGRLLANFACDLTTVSDGKGKRVFKSGKTIYDNYDTPMDRMLRWNKEKNRSSIMSIIVDEICSTIFKGHIQKRSDGFHLIDVDSEDSILINENRLRMFSASCDKAFEDYLYLYNGDYIYSYECLKQYEWFRQYYYTVLNYMCNIIAVDENIITADSVLKNIVSKSKMLKINKNITNVVAKTKVTEILLPDFFDLEYEDLLELQYYASDELDALRDYLYNMKQFEFEDEVNEYIRSKVNPSIKEFKAKVTNMKISLLQKAIRDLKNPISYLPLLTTFITDIDATIAGAVSLGIMGADLALEYLKEKNNVMSDPIYFTLDLNKKIRTY